MDWMSDFNDLKKDLKWNELFAETDKLIPICKTVK